jgi:hypothetical protein
MNTKNVLLSAFIVLTIIFASLTLVEHNQVGTMTTTTTVYTNTTSTSTTCANPPLVGCVPIDVPVLLSASVNQSSVVTACGMVAQGNPQAVCDVTISEGVSGTIVLNLTSQNGGSQVAFGTYSSESQYVQFTSTYPCLYSTESPDYNTDRCPVSTAGSTYEFSYTVAQSLPAQEDAVLTIAITKTCCWP